jgi:Sap-like sulfolipid-1-addressing protein
MIYVLHGQDFSSKHSTPSKAASTAEIVLGALLLVVSVRMYRRPKSARGPESPPQWLDRVEATHWSLCVVVGAVMLSYALTLTAAAETLKANVGRFEAITAGVVFAAASIITIAAPLIVSVTAPDRAARVLETWRSWVSAHARTIALIALVLIGTALIARGAYDLAA